MCMSCFDYLSFKSPIIYFCIVIIILFIYRFSHLSLAATTDHGMWNTRGISTINEWANEVSQSRFNKNVLLKDCITAIIELQINFQTKESKLAEYHQKGLQCSMEACTISPAESMNCALKHKSLKLSSMMNLDKSLNRLIDGISTRLRNRKKWALTGFRVSTC